MNKISLIIIGLIFFFIIHANVTGYIGKEKYLESFFNEKSEYLITQMGKDINLYLNNQKLGSFSDSYRYSEFVIESAFSHKNCKDVLIISDLYNDMLNSLSNKIVENIDILTKDVSKMAHNESYYFYKNSNHKNISKKVNYINEINKRYDLIILDKFLIEKSNIEKFYNLDNIKKYKNMLKSNNSMLYVTFSSAFFTPKIYNNYLNSMKKLFKTVLKYKINIPSIIQNSGFICLNEETNSEDFLKNKINYKSLKYLSSYDHLKSHFYFAKDEKNDIILKHFEANLFENIVKETNSKLQFN